MKNYLYLFVVCSLLVSCHQVKQEEEQECCTCESLTPCDAYGLSQYPAAWPAKQGLWDYPVKPGMEEWNKNHKEENVNACQIPEELLSSLSTEDLTNICVRYPYLMDVFAWNTFHYALEAKYNEFNGIRELFKRKETSKELLKYCICLQTLSNSNFDFEEDLHRRFEFRLFLCEVEFLLGFYTQKADAISEEDCKQILQCLCLAIDHEHELGIHRASKYNYYARANAINRIDPKIFENMPYMYDGTGCGVLGYFDELKDIINELSYRLIK